MLLERKGLIIGKCCAAVLGFAILPQSQAQFSSVHTMLEGLRPTAAANAPQLNQVILALDGLPANQDKAAILSTLVPITDLSILSASESANRRLIKRLNQRYLPLSAHNSGYNSGDDEDFWDEIFQSDEQPPQNENISIAPGPQDESIDEKYDFTFVQPKEEAPAEPAEPVLSNGLWGMVYASDAREKDIDNYFGYESTILGGFLGRDWLFNDTLTIGGVIGYQQADVNSNVISGSYLDIKRFQVSLYAHNTIGDTFYLLGLITGAYNQYDSHRNILIPPVGGSLGFSGKAHGDFDAWEGHAHLEGGFLWHWGGWHMSPHLFTNYTHWNIESYSEHDALGLGLHVDSHDINSLQAGGGLLFEYQNVFQRAIVSPYIQAHLLYDFIQDRQRNVSQFQGGGFAFQTESRHSKAVTYEVGGGINVHSYKQIVFDLHYEFTARSEYHRHNAALKVRYEWA